MKTIRAILIGIGIWVIAVTFYSLSYLVPILSNPDLQANVVLLSAVLPLVWLGSHLYYKKDKETNGFKVGLVFFFIAALLDALITVPLFIIPNGGTHISFFTDPGFWIIAAEMVATATAYYYLKLNPKTITIKS